MRSGSGSGILVVGKFEIVPVNAFPVHVIHNILHVGVGVGVWMFGIEVKLIPATHRMAKTMAKTMTVRITTN